MTLKEKIRRHRTMIVLALAIIFSGSVFAYAYVQTAALNDRIAILSEEVASTTNALSKNIGILDSRTKILSSSLATTRQDVANAAQNITSVQSKVGGVEQTVGSLASTTATLQKLATTDPELLKKYSKVYFLNENYTPAHLTQIPQKYVYSYTKKEQFLTEALPFLTSMLNAASSSGVTIYVESAYRSFATQEALKSRYSVTYGAGTANAFSADQGYSEHQLGTTADFITPGLGGQLDDTFDTTKAYTWLKDNAYKFGFEMSYPQGNDYYVYEPWHWRFVGVKLAKYLHDNHMNFYDMDQRTIDSYLADLFD